MIKLNSLTLSNFRSFKNETVIEFSPGATILLAPNGTGKTSIFEAIELALTSNVQRLASSEMTALLHEGAYQGAISVDYGTWKREIIINRDSLREAEPGQLADLFGGVDLKDVPYLLRLTHLLDQRERQWFVSHTKSEDAGKNLSKLPIGKDATHVSSVIQGVKSGITRELNNLQKDLERERDVFKNWARALEERNRAKQSVAANLEPLDHISGELSVLLTIEEKEPATLNALEWKCAAAFNSIKQEQEAIKQHIDIVSALKLIPDDYANEKLGLQIAKTQKDIDDQKLLDARAAEARIRTALDVVDNTRERLKRRSASASNNLKESNDARLLSAELFLLGESASATKKSIEQQEAIAANCREALSRAKATQAIHEEINTLVMQARKKRLELNVAKTALTNWNNDAVALQQINVKLNEVAEHKASLESVLALTRERVTNVAAEAKSAHEAVQLLNRTLGQVRSAVLLIIENLPKDQDVCPVCGTNHPAGELHNRIAHILNQENPNLNALLVLSKEKSERLREVELIFESVKGDYKRALDTLSMLESERELYIRNIDELRQHPMLLGIEHGEAEAFLAKIEYDLNKTEEGIGLRRMQAPPEVMTGEIATIEEKIRVASEASQSLKQQLAKLSQSANSKESALDAILRFGPIQDIKSLNENLREFEALHHEADMEANRLIALLQHAENDVLRAQLAVKATQDSINEISKKVKDLTMRWERASFDGEPNSATLMELTASLVKQHARVGEKLEKIEKIKSKLLQWRAAEDLRRAQETIETLLKGKSETEFSNFLSMNMRGSESALEVLRRKRDALELFSMQLTKEIANVQQNVSSIMPYWQSLLRRILRDSRFSLTNLEFFSKHNKSHALITVPLADGFVPAADIASEAQLTDIQLSFLLSMALKHKWSNWKALLLDDPTQHHDLGHAASVFDVLREYISEHGFQVVIATHDALQARFFMRKLRNDGVPVRLLALRPDVSGIRVEKLGAFESGV
ncbi:AAA family ATPase [Azohydromonas lata]|uniref:AAA family ATPase n=1 Tax=Azohydromonas lata TaxID=45677 RepID=UPI0009FC4A0F|nr:SMC family ATPase [Azohydromonas lata]